MIIFDTCGLYLESKTDLRSKITTIDAIINSMYAALITAAANEGLGEYQFNDGQVIIKQVFRGSKGITAGIQALRIIRQDYINQYNGRVFRAVDSKNFRNGSGF